MAIEAPDEIKRKIEKQEEVVERAKESGNANAVYAAEIELKRLKNLVNENSETQASVPVEDVVEETKAENNNAKVVDEKPQAAQKRAEDNAKKE